MARKPKNALKYALSKTSVTGTKNALLTDTFTALFNVPYLLYFISNLPIEICAFRTNPKTIISCTKGLHGHTNDNYLFGPCFWTEQSAVP